jgi:glutaconate CoA-transferase subunit A
VLAAGTLPGFYIDTIAVTPNGCWPLGLPDHYGADLGHIGEYARMAATAEGFGRYLEQYVFVRHAA